MSLVRQVMQRCGAMRDAGLARVWSGRRPILCASAVLVLAGGCSLVLNTDRQQCDAPADCAKILGGPENTYTCDQHLCQRVVECSTTPDCSNEEGRSICAPDGQCVQCILDTDCGTSSAQCVAGICEDAKWGCVTSADSRPPPTMPTATFRINVANIVTGAPLSGLVATPCVNSTADPDCTKLAFENYVSSYDPGSGDVTITGVPTHLPIYIRLVPEASLDMATVYFSSNRTLREGDMYAPLKLGSRAAQAGVANSLNPPPDLKKGIINVQVHDCTGALAAGVTIGLVNPPADLITGYRSETGIPNFAELRQTTAAGGAILLNVPPLAITTIVATVSATKSFSTQIVHNGAATSVVDLYPGKFQ